MVTETDVHVLKEKSADENPIVRTEAFNTISKLEHREFDESLLSIMEVGCSDHDVDTKKAAMKALSEIFKAKFHNTKVLKGWVRSIPRLITDEDKSVRKECEKVFKELVLDRISQAQSRHHEVLFNYGIVLMLTELDGGEVSKWVKKIIGNLGKNCKVEPDVARSLCFIIERSERTWLELKKPIDKWLAPAGAWFLLSEVSRFLIDVVNYNFLLHYWELLTNKSNDKAKEKDKHNSKHRASNRASLLEMIATRCVIPAHPVDKVDMGKQFLQRITSFQIPCTEVDVLLRAFNELYQQLASNREDCGEQMTTAVNKMLSQAKNILSSHKKKSDACLYKATYMIGSVACVYTEHDYLPIAQYLLELVISLQDEKEAPLYIQIWLTICKLWYVDDQVGITYASKLLEVLKDTNAHEVVRSSILMNVTHHQLHESEIYEWYSAGITKCLYDRSEVVRRQAFKLLCRLLTEGGKNLKPQLFLQFLRSIVDDSENIKELANGLFWNQLKAEEPELVYDMFVDAIFDLNDCDSKTIKCKPKHTSVRGIKMMSSDQRNTIYVSMLKQMTPCQINSTYENICFQILGSETVVNSLHDSSRFVLEDALAILSYKDIQIPSPSGVVFNADMIQIYIKLITRIETTYTSLMRGLLHLYKKHGTDFEMINGDDAAKLKSEILKYEVTQKKEENINGKKI